MALEFTIPEFSRYLTGLPAKMIGNTKKLMEVCKVIIKNDIKEGFQKGVDPDGSAWKPLAFPRPNGKSSPLWDTGALVRSTGAGTGHVERMTADSLEIGTNLQYASIHQYGGTIVPVRSKFLAIPLTMAAKRAGGARNFPGKLQPIINRRTGKGVLVGAQVKTVQRGKRKGQQSIGKTVAQYALVKSVKIPARPYMGFGRRLVSKLEAAVAKFVNGVP